MNNTAARPGQQSRNDKADALAAPGRRETQDVLWPIVAKVVAAEPAEHDTVLAHELRGPQF